MSPTARRALRLAPLLFLFTLASSGAPAETKKATAPAVVQWQHDWARGAVFYEVFVRSFADSDGDGDGDLRGLTAKLDYLKDLGVDALWLMPVFESPSDHGSGTLDPEKIQSAYGTAEDFDRFLAEAHRRGINVVLDFVANPTSQHHDGYVWRTELPMSFNVPLAEAIVKAVHDGDASGVAAKLQEMAGVYPAGIIDTPFLTHHDQQRVATDLGNDPAKLRSAAAVLLTLPGAPFLYYGEEVGLQNGPGSKDEFKRTPMPWDETAGGGFTTGHPWFDFAPGRETANVALETGDPSSLLSYYRQLIRLRHASAALKKGDLKLLTPCGGSAQVLAFLRQSGKEQVLVVHNLGTAEVAAGPYAIAGRRLDLLFGPTAKPLKGIEGWTVTVPAGASGVWRVR